MASDGFSLDIRPSVDEGVGARTKIRQAVHGSVVDHQRGDTGNAESLAGVIGRQDVFDLSDAKPLEATDPTTSDMGEAAGWGAPALTDDQHAQGVVVGVNDAADKISRVLPG